MVICGHQCVTPVAKGDAQFYSRVLGRAGFAAGNKIVRTIEKEINTSPTFSDNLTKLERTPGSFANAYLH